MRDPVTVKSVTMKQYDVDTLWIAIVCQTPCLRQQFGYREAVACPSTVSLSEGWPVERHSGVEREGENESYLGSDCKAS